MPRSNGRNANKINPQTRYLACKAEPGMFRDEFLVYLAALNPERPDKRLQVQLLVDRNELMNLQGEPKRNQPVPGWLRVTLTKEVKGVAHVILPQPAQPVGEGMWVDVNDLRKKAG